MQQTNLSPISALITTKCINYNYQCVFHMTEWELSNLDSLMPITTTLKNFAIYLSVPILGNKPLTLRWIK